MKDNKRYFTFILVLIIIIMACFLVRGFIYDRPPIETPPKVTPDTLVPIEYAPMQCEITPWYAWLQNSSIRFIRAPTEQEVLNMFYSNEYNITLSEITIVNISEAVCEACGVCKKGYVIDTFVKLKDIQVMLDTGWKRV